MAHQILQDVRVLALVAVQHGVITRAQLLALGYTADAIKHLIRTGALHPVARGVYAFGRPAPSREGTWMAAVLSCGPEARLSHGSATALMGIAGYELSMVEVTLPPTSCRRRPGVRVHRRRLTCADVGTANGIPVTSPTRTILDLAPRLSTQRLERLVNEADRLELVFTTELRRQLDARAGERGVRRLRTMLDQRTFRLTDSELERRFLPLVRRAGLPVPRTRAHVNGFRVDFFWPDLALVVETDGLRYHRTPAQQARDRLRDQTHARAGLTPLRFTHAQIRYEPQHVVAVLRDVHSRLARHFEAFGAL